MRFYPRQAKSRQDALMGKGHIGTGYANFKTLQDQILRVRPDVDTDTMVTSTFTCYGGSAG